MPATKARTHTEDGEGFSPVTEDLHPHGEDPTGGVPGTIEELSDELERLSGKLYDAALVLRRVSGYFEDPDHEGEHGTVWTAVGLAERSHRRLQEAADALSKGHTENIGWRMNEVALPVGNANSLISDWLGGYPSDTAESAAGTLYSTGWTFDFVAKRLRFLTEEADLPLDE